MSKALMIHWIGRALVFSFSMESDLRPKEAMVIEEKNTRDKIFLVVVGGEGKRNYAEQLWKFD